MEMVGTVAFAASGAMVAADCAMDIFGVIVLGVTTAVGGGLLRDVMAGVPPYILVRHIYACASIVGAMVCVWLFKKKLTCIKQKKKQFRLLLLAYKRGNQYIVFVFMIKAEYPEELRSLLHRYVS